MGQHIKLHQLIATPQSQFPFIHDTFGKAASTLRLNLVDYPLFALWDDVVDVVFHDLRVAVSVCRSLIIFIGDLFVHVVVDASFWRRRVLACGIVMTVFIWLFEHGFVGFVIRVVVFILYLVVSHIQIGSLRTANQ